MLSPHEFATLMLVRQAPDQLDMNRAELDSLLERQLVMLEHCSTGRRRVHLTGKGRSFFDALYPDDRPHRQRASAPPGDRDRPESRPLPGARPTDLDVPESAG